MATRAGTSSEEQMQTTGPRRPAKKRSEAAPATSEPTKPPLSMAKRQRAAVCICMPLASSRKMALQSESDVRTSEMQKYDAPISHSSPFSSTCFPSMLASPEPPSLRCGASRATCISPLPCTAATAAGEPNSRAASTNAAAAAAAAGCAAIPFPAVLPCSPGADASASRLARSVRVVRPEQRVQVVVVRGGAERVVECRQLGDSPCALCRGGGEGGERAL
mmetsp:Transcript_11762/g.38487  ORF Transcript_11762/g.38487 Transcript_11762/m.38487 type:complete len:220 (-) Transcript_11762:283-942(-)